MFGSRKAGPLIMAPLVVIALALPACGEDETTVGVTVQEFSVGLDPPSVPAGSVTFDVTNEGPNDAHEFVLFATDLDVTDLPTVEDGSVDEEGEGVELIDEIEDIPVGETQSVTIDLEPGSYAVICNIVEEEDGELEAHYQEGMRAAFTVEE